MGVRIPSGPQNSLTARYCPAIKRNNVGKRKQLFALDNVIDDVDVLAKG